MRSPVEDHDLVPSLPGNLESQTHSRVSKCDGRYSVQVEPSAVSKMVTVSTGVKTELSKVVHPSCRSICHFCEPQIFTVYVSSPRPKCLGHRCSKHKLVGSHCLCLPSDGSPSQGDPKNQAMQLPDHCNSPRLARDALVLGPSAALNRDPTSATSVNNSSQTVPQLCVSQQSKHLILHAWCLGVDSSKNKASLWRWQRELLPLKGHQQGPSTSQSGPYLRKGAEKIRWISQLPHVPLPISNRNLPKWNLSVVLNELIKAPFELIKDTDLKHLTLKTAFLLPLTPASATVNFMPGLQTKYLI